MAESPSNGTITFCRCCASHAVRLPLMPYVPASIRYISSIQDFRLHQQAPDLAVYEYVLVPL